VDGLLAWAGIWSSFVFLAWSLLAGGQIRPMLMPVGIALVNLAVVVPIVRSGKPRQYSAADAQAVLG